MMDPVLIAAILVPALPAAAAVVLACFGRWIGTKSGIVACTALAGSVASSVFMLTRVLGAPASEAPLLHSTFTWVTIGGSAVRFGLLVNGLTVSVLTMVAVVALMVFTYAIGYMHGDPRFAWFFSVFSLFTASMFVVVSASNLLMLMVGWEVMGLCSYLLIGFWYDRPEARSASIKAFLTTRVGDMGFLAAVMLLFARYGTLDILELLEKVETGPHDTWLFIVAALLFCGAVSKSAQFPLHIWLPDAMAGPTPVSGLLHSATMVAAGVYMVARMFPMFEASGFLPFVAGAGIFSAIFGASLALTENDVKRTLAYSTMSQLGYMMAALGSGGLVVAVFHLITHGFFKSLLFLSAGSVIHGTDTQDVRELGGLQRKMKWTSIAFLTGSLALAGIPPLAGFFSKDGILLSMWNETVFAAGGGKVLFIFGLGTAVLSAFYMLRMYLRIFTGPVREHAHESPKVMLLPMLVLAAVTAVAGVINLPGVKPSLLEIMEPGATENVLWWLMGLSIAAAGMGVYVAWEQNRARLLRAEGVLAPTQPYGLEPFYRFIFLKQVFDLSEGMRRVNVDSIVKQLVIEPVFAISEFLSRLDFDVVYFAVFVTAPMAIAETFSRIDVGGVDGLVNLVGNATLGLSRVFRRLQTGVVANYALFMLLFGVVIWYVVKYWRFY